MPEGTSVVLNETTNKMISKFIDKCLSLVRMGKEWLCRLYASMSEAARTQSYIETTSPTQADTLHKAIKEIDLFALCRGYETIVRKCLPLLLPSFKYALCRVVEGTKIKAELSYSL